MNKNIPLSGYSLIKELSAMKKQTLTPTKQFFPPNEAEVQTMQNSTSEKNVSGCGSHPTE